MQTSRTKHMFSPGVFAVAFFLLCAVPGQGQQKQVVPGPKNLPYSEGIVRGKTLYIAGQTGEDEDRVIKNRGIGAETQRALENLAKVVKAAGFKLTDVVSVTVYLADFNEFDAMNTVYRGFMPDPKPARTTVQVVRLIDNARVEISAIAVKQ